MKFARSLIVAVAIATPLQAIEPMAIQDNSFLVEEAYNQEAGVVQHIFTFSRDGDESVAAFGQEFPAGGQRHQLSYAISILSLDRESGLGDTMLNYRYQLIGDGTTTLAVSPRVSLIVPTGDSDRGLGAGNWGYELNLPVSFAFSDRLVTHWNAGITDTDDAEYFAGASVIAAARKKFHLMLETKWTSEGDATFVVAPGVRWAHDLKNGFQIVPGIAVPISDDGQAIFLYLSLER